MRDAADEGKGNRTPLVFSKAVLYVHVTRETVEDILNGVPDAEAGVARVEDIGPVIADQVKAWLGHTQVTVKPVIDLDAIPPVDRWEIPPRIAEAVGLIHPSDYSPYGTTTSPHQDHDHITPYLPMNKGGPPGQTDPLKLGRLPRRRHRLKTHTRWTVQQLHPGSWLWRTPHGWYTLVNHHGTTPLGRL